MTKTNHMISRMTKRAIDQSLVEIACHHGERDNRNRILLNLKEIDAQLIYLEATKQALLQARKKGGVVVVEENGTLITTYIRGRYNKGSRRGR